MSSSRPANSAAAWRLRVYPLAVIAALMASVVIGAIGAADSAAPGAAIGGDFPAFYGAGIIAAEGDLNELHDVARQVEAQAGLHRVEDGEVTRFFPYPAQFAVLYQPLASFEYHWAYLIHTAIMGGLLLAAIMLARPMLPWIEGKVTLALAAALLFWPMFRTITGGSNTAFTLFLITAGWRLIHDDRRLAAGFVLAGLLFKPQLAIPLLGLYALGRYWRVVAGSAVGAAAYYLWGAAIQGWSWAFDWAEMARDFGAKEAEINGHSSISFIGFAQNLFGVGFNAPVILAWVCAISMALFLSWLWWSRRIELPHLLAITVPGMLLLAPHVMTHDGALIVLTAGVAVGAWDRGRWTPWVGVVWLLGATQSMIMKLGFSPGFPMLLIVATWAWLIAHDHQSGAAEVPGSVLVQDASGADPSANS